MTTSYTYTAAELEWWDDRAGRDIALTAARAIGADGLHVANPELLEHRPVLDGKWQGEGSLWVIFPRGRFRLVFEAVCVIRDQGVRVHSAAHVPASLARADLAQLIHWWTGGVDRPEPARGW